jgi:hypothetical protein
MQAVGEIESRACPSNGLTYRRWIFHFDVRKPDKLSQGILNAASVDYSSRLLWPVEFAVRARASLTQTAAAVRPPYEP